MPTFASRALALFTVAFAALACSSSDSSGDNCPGAKTAVDACNSHAGASGVTFDQQECETGGDAKKAVANCIVANKDSCGCMVPCIDKATCG